jgi:hypothetical protein
MIPGTSCLATIVQSLRDKIRSTAEALIKLAVEPPGLNPTAPAQQKSSQTALPFAFCLSPGPSFPALHNQNQLAVVGKTGVVF